MVSRDSAWGTHSLVTITLDSLLLDSLPVNFVAALEAIIVLASVIVSVVGVEAGSATSTVVRLVVSLAAGLAAGSAAGSAAS